MRIFLSWSGERSKAVAQALCDLLPEAINLIAPWMSENDIAAGARWGQELSIQLEESKFGIICLTPENLNVPWVLFEAGALSKTVSGSFVVPYRLGLHPSDVPFPLAQFQGVDADEAGTLRMLHSINNVCEQVMPSKRLESIFSRWWPDLKNQLERIPARVAAVSMRNERALIEEILDLTRGLVRGASSPSVDPLAIADLVSGYSELVDAAAEYGVPPSLYKCLKRIHAPLRSLVLASGPAGRRAAKKLSEVSVILESEIEKYIKAGGVIVPRKKQKEDEPTG